MPANCIELGMLSELRMLSSSTCARWYRVQFRHALCQLLACGCPYRAVCIASVTQTFRPITLPDHPEVFSQCSNGNAEHMPNFLMIKTQQPVVFRKVSRLVPYEPGPNRIGQLNLQEAFILLCGTTHDSAHAMPLHFCVVLSYVPSVVQEQNLNTFCMPVDSLKHN